MTGQILTLKETADYLKISRSAIYRLINSGDIQAHKFGGSLRFRLEDIDKFISKSKLRCGHD